jgi:hypothetical protein
MTTTKLLSILATTIAAGLLILATTNVAVAVNSAQSIIGQLNAQYSKCISGTTTTSSCNPTASNSNVGNAVSAATGGSGGSSASSQIGQSNFQGAFVFSGGATTGSGNLNALNSNNGTAVSGAG